MSEKLKTIPQLHLDVQALIQRADLYKDTLTYSSEIRGTYYAADKQEILILTTQRGYLRIRVEDVDTLIEELEEIAENSRSWRRR